MFSTYFTGSFETDADLLHEPLVVLVARELGIDDDEPLRGDADERIRAGASDHVEIRLELANLLDRLPRRRASATRSSTLRSLRGISATRCRDHHGNSRKNET